MNPSPPLRFPLFTPPFSVPFFFRPESPSVNLPIAAFLPPPHSSRTASVIRRNVFLFLPFDSPFPSQRGVAPFALEGLFLMFFSSLLLFPAPSQVSSRKHSLSAGTCCFLYVRRASLSPSPSLQMPFLFHSPSLCFSPTLLSLLVFFPMGAPPLFFPPFFLRLPLPPLFLIDNKVIPSCDLFRYAAPPLMTFSFLVMPYSPPPWRDFFPTNLSLSVCFELFGFHAFWMRWIVPFPPLTGFFLLPDDPFLFYRPHGCPPHGFLISGRFPLSVFLGMRVSPRRHSPRPFWVFGRRSVLPFGPTRFFFLRFPFGGLITPYFSGVPGLKNVGRFFFLFGARSISVFLLMSGSRSSPFPKCPGRVLPSCG